MTTEQGVEQDLAVDLTNLPADHPVKFLAEAQQLYKRSKPPFVFGLKSRPHELSKEVFVALNGKRPDQPIRAHLIARKWGKHTKDGTFWTLDINRQRIIVAAFPNSGCVPGAKWVYCPWTGVEHFEEKPLAFSCIHGDYTNALSLKTQDHAVTPQPRTKETTSTTETAVEGLGHERPQNVAALPEDHPVEYLDEAKAVYTKSIPPFVINRNKTKNSPRRGVTIVPDGKILTTPTKADVEYRAWDSLYDYGTADLKGKRFIVRGSPGGPSGGYQYRLWLGCKVGDDDKVNAKSQPNDANTTTSSLTEALSELGEASSSSELSNDDEDEVAQGGVRTEAYSYESFRRAFDPMTDQTSKPSLFSEQTNRPRRTIRPTKRARSSTPPFNPRSREGKETAHAPKRVSRRPNQPSQDLSGVSSPPYETPAHTPNLTGHHQPSQLSISQPSTSRPETSQSETHQTQIQDTSSLPTIAPHKQKNAILRATRDSNVIGFVPLRLSACMTMSTLFSSVVAASGHREDQESIKCLMATFDWKEESDLYKTIYINKETEGSFEIFLELIDEAPCWKEEGGKCGIAVEVVRV